MEAEKTTRRVWTREETRCLLTFYSQRREEFNRPRRKKFAYANLVKDLTSAGVLKSPVTPAIVENKIKSVLRSYKAMEDAGNNSETGYFDGPYADLLEKIFAAKACKKSDVKHTISAGSLGGKSLSFERGESSSSGAPSPLSAGSTFIDTSPPLSPDVIIVEGTNGEETPTQSAESPITSQKRRRTFSEIDEMAEIMKTQEDGKRRRHEERELRKKKELEFKEKMLEELRLLREQRERIINFLKSSKK